MPEITDSTPKTTITIASKSFTVPQPYAAGHVLTANEASAVNQVFAENLRNNFASKVKAADEAGTFDQDVLQGALDDYANDYEFGVRTGGGRTGDPVRQEAMNIARDMVRKAIAKKGLKVSDYSGKAISAKAQEVLDSGKYPQILETAKARVESARDIADVEIDSLEPAATEETTVSEDAPARKGKGKGAAASDA